MRLRHIPGASGRPLSGIRGILARMGDDGEKAKRCPILRRRICLTDDCRYFSRLLGECRYREWGPVGKAPRARRKARVERGDAPVEAGVRISAAESRRKGQL